MRGTINFVTKKTALRAKTLIDKINRLPPEKAAAVEDFVDFLSQRDERQLTRVAAQLSEKVFARVWDNPRDAAYDRL